MRCLAAAVAALLACLASVLVLQPASAAPRQADEACFPTDDSDYPPEGPNVQIEVQLRLVSGHFIPGGLGVIRVGGATVGLRYCGTLFSDPVPLEPDSSDAGGFVDFSEAVPADFELNAMHHIDVFRQQSQVGSFDFCVDGNGDVAATSVCDADRGNAGPLPRTGADYLIDGLKFAAFLLALGAALVYWRRRQMAQRPDTA